MQRISFFAGYEIQKTGFDVFLFGSTTRHKEEYRRLEDEECFSDTITGIRRILELKVKDAKPGLEYCIKWQPPKRRAYHRWLQSLEGET